MYLWPLTGDSGYDAQVYESAPIEVTGTPVQIDQNVAGVSDAKLLAAVDAMRWNDSELVPVSPDPYRIRGVVVRAPEPAQRVTGIEFEPEPGCLDTEPGRLDMEPAERIELRLKIEDIPASGGEGDPANPNPAAPGVITMPARVYLDGEEDYEMNCRAVPGLIQEDELAEILTRAYWRDREWASRDDKIYDHEETTRRMGHVAIHVLGEPRRAIRLQMERRVNRIDPGGLPLPPWGLSATSNDGRWTLTLNPAPELEPEPRPEPVHGLPAESPV